MESLQRGRYRARLAGSAKDVARAQALRHLCFHRRAGSDADAFDSDCLHVLVEDRESGDLVREELRLHADLDQPAARHTVLVQQREVHGAAADPLEQGDAELLLERVRVVTVPGREFGMDGHLRLSYCGAKADVIEGAKRVCWALDPAAPKTIKIGDKEVTRTWL